MMVLCVAVALAGGVGVMLATAGGVVDSGGGMS